RFNPLRLGRPGLIVTGDLRALATIEEAPLGAIGGGSAGEIGLMRLFPGARLILGFGGHNIGAVMHPAMPAGRNGRGVGKAAGIGHIATVGLAILIVAIAELVGADIVAEALDPEA